MASNLVIVESPAKAKTIEKFLGQDFKVASSFGHIADLPSNELGVDVDGDFSPKYIVSSDKKKVVNELKSLAKKMNTVWLASDEDREGEAIAWHLSNTLGLKEINTKRIVFNEITKTAILDAIENPRNINVDLVNAQQARRVLDRLVGYELSPVLWKTVKGGLSVKNGWKDILKNHILVTGGPWSRHTGYNGNKECFANQDAFHPIGGFNGMHALSTRNDEYKKWGSLYYTIFTKN